MKQLRAVIVEDHPLVVSGIRYHLQVLPAVTVIAHRRKGEDAVPLIQRLHPDLLLLDLKLPGITGLEVLRQVGRVLPRPIVVVVSQYSEAQYVADAVRLGARAFVPKVAPTEELVRAVRSAVAGKRYLAPPIPADEVNDLVQRMNAGEPEMLLNTREREVTQLVSLGLTSLEIAQQLYLSIRTVETYRMRVLNKLGLRNAVELAHYAVDHGLILRKPLLEPLPQSLSEDRVRRRA